jgi:hypothetical protein
VAPVAHSFAGSVPPVIGLQAPLLPVVKLPWHESQVPLHTTSQHMRLVHAPANTRVCEGLT